MSRSIVQCVLTVLAAALTVFAGEPPAGTAIVHPVDGAVMVYVPAGEFSMGMDKPEAEKLAALLGYKDYHTIAAEEWFPQHKVFVPGYFVDKYETTVGQWDAFVKATGHVSKISKLPEKQVQYPELYPAASVSWAEAAKYANWSHKSLPTEAQWEKAARGTDGRWFPWGNEKPTPELGVFVDLENPKNKNEPTHTQMVGSKPKGASPYGCMDMAGNVYEWTSEWFEPYPNNPEADRLFSYTGHTNGVLRGGSFYHADHAYCAAKRFGFKPDETYYHVGFRCVWQPPAGYLESEDFKAAQAKVAGREAEMAEKRAKDDKKK